MKEHFEKELEVVDAGFEIRRPLLRSKFIEVPKGWKGTKRKWIWNTRNTGNRRKDGMLEKRNAVEDDDGSVATAERELAGQ